MRSLAALVFVAGCASGPVERVVKFSTPAPPGSLRVREGERALLVTGAGEVRLDATTDHRLTLEAKGYAPASVELTTGTNGGTIFLLVVESIAVLPLAPVLWIAWSTTKPWAELAPANPWVALARDDE